MTARINVKEHLLDDSRISNTRCSINTNPANILDRPSFIVAIHTDRNICLRCNELRLFDDGRTRSDLIRYLEIPNEDILPCEHCEKPVGVTTREREAGLPVLCRVCDAALIEIEAQQLSRANLPENMRAFV